MKKDEDNKKNLELSEEVKADDSLEPKQEGALPQEVLTPETNKETPKEIDIEEKLKQKEDEIKALNEQIKRMQADFENWKKVLQKKIEDIQNYAAEPLICSLLPLIDNLERAYETSKETQDFKSLADGIGLILRQIEEVLSKEGVRKINCAGETFDPNVHEAVLTESTADHPEDTVVEELQKGYTLKDKVIRPSLVKVAKKPKEDRES